MRINGLRMHCDDRVMDLAGSRQLDRGPAGRQAIRHTPLPVGSTVACSSVAAGQEPPS